MAKREPLGTSRGVILVLVAAVTGGLSGFLREVLDGWLTFWPALVVSALFVGLTVYLAALVLTRRSRA